MRHESRAFVLQFFIPRACVRNLRRLRNEPFLPSVRVEVHRRRLCLFVIFI
jgi:hypothetical protein